MQYLSTYWNAIKVNVEHLWVSLLLLDGEPASTSSFDLLLTLVACVTLHTDPSWKH